MNEAAAAMSENRKRELEDGFSCHLLTVFGASGMSFSSLVPSVGECDYRALRPERFIPTYSCGDELVTYHL